MSLFVVSFFVTGALALLATVAFRNRAHIAKVATLSLSASLLVGLSMVPSASASTMPQKALKIANTSHSAPVGSSVKVTAKGGSGTGMVSFKVSGAHCSINAKTGLLKATASATCTVVASKAASSRYKATKSAAVRFVFSVSQAALRITNSSLKGEVGTAITVTAAGGTGSGAVTFDTTGAVCSINPATGELTAGATGSCPVTATKAGSGNLPAVTSAPVTFVFGVGSQATLTIANSPLTGFVGTAVTVFTSGGSGTGILSFTVTGAGCSIVSGSGALSDSAAGTCVVTAHKAASSGYNSASSAPADFVFTVSSGGGGGSDNPTFSMPDSAVLTSITGIEGSSINDTVSGDKNFINQYYSGTDRWLENYVDAGATLTMTWHVTGSSGQILPDTPVTLTDNLQYACAKGTTWSNANLNINPGCGAGTMGTVTGTTDASGNVSFTVVNTNSATGTRPTDLTSTAGAEAAETVYNWTRFILQIGTDTITANPNTTVDQATDLVDVIIIPAS